MIEDLPSRDLDTFDKVITVKYDDIEELMSRREYMKARTIQTLCEPDNYKIKDTFITSDDKGYTLYIIITPVQ